MSLPAPADVAELVRLPAVLSVPGDVLVGAAVSGQVRDLPRTAGLVAASSCMYLAGMALNDYADREIDAVERPGRPIPSGRVTPGFALGLAGALTLGAAALSVAADGPRALAVTAPLAAAVWGYDLTLKSQPIASASMSACRGLDVMMGAGAHGAAAAVPAAAVVAAHIAVVTEVSRREVTGGDPAVPKRALVATLGVAAAGALLSRRAPRLGRAAALGLVGAYAGIVGRAHADAVADPSPARMQRAVGAGILGLIPLEAGLLAGSGAIVPAAGVATLWPIARKAAKKRAVT
ncbi:SCO3242 family prenyltransferase [Solirubrobacter soli]|uniref:SCO3242 family prenyltransferase n=1 Tax=Solirubrobacter soli TaxID=363832 RepID=UPI000429CFA6|nr:UbiA family prenyltransferase [Solirubrobacter soli]